MMLLRGLQEILAVSFDHLVGPHEQRCRKLHSDLPGGLQIENHLKPLRLIKRNFAGWRAFEHLRNGGCCIPE